MTVTATETRVSLPELARRMCVHRSLVYATKDRFATLAPDPVTGVLSVTETEAMALRTNGIPPARQHVSGESAFQRRRNVRNALWAMLADLTGDIDDNDEWWVGLAESNALDSDEMAAIRDNVHELLRRKAVGYLRS